MTLFDTPMSPIDINKNLEKITIPSGTTPKKITATKQENGLYEIVMEYDFNDKGTVRPGRITTWGRFKFFGSFELTTKPEDEKVLWELHIEEK